MVYILRTFQILFLKLLTAPRTTIYTIPIIFIFFIYYKAFLPSAVRDWNNITDEHRNVDTVIAFKNVLSCDKPVVPKRYFFGSRKNKSFTHA